MIYWTKYKMIYSEVDDMYYRSNELEIIKQSEEDFVTDGEGFEIDMNGIDYQKYLNNVDKYFIEKGKLFPL